MSMSLVGLNGPAHEILVNFAYAQNLPLKVNAVISKWD